MLIVNGKIVSVEHFLSGEQRINFKVEKDAYDVIWLYDNDEELITLIYLCKHIKYNGGELATLIMPYIPNARMDRVYNSQEEVFTLKYFAEIINSLGFKNIWVENAHSNVSLGLLNSVEDLNDLLVHDINTVLDKIKLETKNEIKLFYPDAGAVKRYSKLLSKEYLYGNKTRRWDNGEIQGLEVIGETPDGCDILIIDDICSKGGTFYYAAKQLKEMGAKNIYLYITHCENSIFNGTFGEEHKNLLDTGLIKHVYTTQSIYRGTDNRITVVGGRYNI